VHGFTADPDGRVRFTLARPAQPLADIVAEAGGAFPDALL
jgi:diaminopimelate decarboxylase